MPAPEQILLALQNITAEWPRLALLWHALLGLLTAALAAGWRPERRDLGLYLVLPFISVSALAWIHGNPFTGTGFAAIGLVLLVVSMALGRERVVPAPIWAVTAGVMLVGIGWYYPHFLASADWWQYLYRSPLGLVPCPTLAVATGLSLVFGAFGSRAWRWVLGLTGLFYGLVGAVYLGVILDWALVAGALLLLGMDRLGAGRHPGNASRA